MSVILSPSAGTERAIFAKSLETSGSDSGKSDLVNAFMMTARF